MQEIVSVIIPVFNGESTIEKAVTSVILQTYKYTEIIIIDDCSTDNTYKIVETLIAKDPRIVYYKNKENMGVAATRNFGCNKAKGKYIAFLDCDDEWYPEKLTVQLAYLEKFKYDFCYTAYKMCDKNSNIDYEISVPQTISYKSLLKENVVCCSTVLIKKECLGKEPFCKRYFHEDFILWLELLKRGIKAVGISECLLLYSKGGRSADKYNAMKYRWLIYRKCEKLGIVKSIYYFCFYGINGIKKYLIKKHSAKHIRQKYRSESTEL